MTFPHFSVFVRRLEVVHSLSEIERALIARLGVFRESIQAGTSCRRVGQSIVARVIISGWVCRQRTLPDGRRQIFGFLIPGDAIGLDINAKPLDRLTTVAVNRVECMDALVLREVMAVGDPRYARLKAAIDELRRLEDVYLLNQVMRLGRQSALERLSHLLLELHERTRLAGLHYAGTFPLPLTQEVLADALGLSLVHLNRTLTQLRRSGLVELKCGRATILDIGRLQVIAAYDGHDE